MVMYISRVPKGILSPGRAAAASAALALCLFLLAPAALPAAEQAIELGRDRLWKDMRSLDGVTAVPGRWGFQDLVLSSGEYTVDPSTEMLFHFDGPAQSDAAGAWEFDGREPAVSESVAAMGGASASFSGAPGGIGLRAPPGSLFSAGAAWGDFTVEFWLYPAALSNGESVLAWDGTLRESGTRVPQAIRARLRDRRLVWEFSELFVLPSGRRLPVHLEGTRQLLPRTWHHHLLRFDAAGGILEYLLDGVPEAIAWVTSSGREGGDPAAVRTGREHAGPVVLGAGFTGFLDELRVSRRFVEEPVLQRFLGRTGTAVSQIIDLGYSGTRIVRIESVTSAPGDSAVELSYQVSDSWTIPRILKSETDWVPLAPSGELGEGVRGRWIQVMAELFPDGSRTRTPRVSSIRIVTEPNLPPVPPAGVAAEPGNGKVTLSWRRSTEPGVKGYLVYYGGAPHTFLGTGASPGDSPVDVGDVPRIEIGGLANGSLYYFAVVAYDGSQPRQQSPFSAEVSARPSRMYK
jgi:hypothetical protein